MEKISKIKFQSKKEQLRCACGAAFKRGLNKFLNFYGYDFFGFLSFAKNANLQAKSSAKCGLKFARIYALNFKIYSQNLAQIFQNRFGLAVCENYRAKAVA